MHILHKVEGYERHKLWNSPFLDKSTVSIYFNKHGDLKIQSKLNGKREHFIRMVGSNGIWMTEEKEVDKKSKVKDSILLSNIIL